MLKSIIAEGKTTNEAIEKGLKELNVSKNEVDIKVLETEEKRSFFDILAPRVVKVELTLKEIEKRNSNESVLKNDKKEEKEIDEKDLNMAKSNVDNFLNEFLKKVSVKEFYYIVEIQGNKINVDIKGEDAGILIGYRGDSMNSLQNILSAIANRGIDARIKVLIDIEGYREKRIKVLEELATKVSKTVIKTGKAITLEPMTAYERKIIHSKLQENSYVTTYSVGEEPYRKIVIAKK